MFFRKILGRSLTTATEKQELSSRQALQVSTEPRQQLELIPATPSIQQYPQQMILRPCYELHFHPPNHPQQLNQPQAPYPQHFYTSLNSSSVSPNQKVLNPFLTSALIQTPSSSPPHTPLFQMATSRDNTATLINFYLTLLSQSQTPSTPPLTAPNPSSQHIYPNSHHTFQSSSSTLRESHHTPPTSSHSSNQSLPSFIPTESSSSVHNEIKLLKEENRRLSDKVVLIREKKRQQSHEIEILEDKVGQLKRTNKEMKQKIVTLKHQQDDQINLMTQQIEIQREMQSDIQQLFHSYEGKKAGRQMVVSN